MAPARTMALESALARPLRGRAARTASADAPANRSRATDGQRAQEARPRTPSQGARRVKVSIDGREPLNREIDPTRSLRLSRLSWPEVRHLLTSDPRLILPVGALDHHGPHLPLGRTHSSPSASPWTFPVACSWSRLRLSITALTKPDWAPYPGTGTLRRKTFHRAINELLASWDDHGIDEVVIITAQRHEPHIEALLTALTESATTEIVDLMTIDVSDLVEGHPEHERGGELETSLLLFLAPELVRMDEAVDFLPQSQSSRKYVEGRVTTPPPRFQGVVGRPTLATAEKGAAIYHRYTSVLTEALTRHSPSDAREGR